MNYKKLQDWESAHFTGSSIQVFRKFNPPKKLEIGRKNTRLTHLIIKEEIKKFYTEKTLPFLKDIYSRIPEIQNLGFKDCGITTFQKIMKKWVSRKRMSVKFPEEF